MFKLAAAMHGTCAAVSYTRLLEAALLPASKNGVLLDMDLPVH